MSCAICGSALIAKETLEFPDDKRLCPGDFERCGRPELPMSDSVLTALRWALASERRAPLQSERRGRTWRQNE